MSSINIPKIGLGTWQITDREAMANTMTAAMDEGYRLFDIAAAYQNEMNIGRVIKELPPGKREELYLSDKVWNTYRSRDLVKKAVEGSLKKLKTDYLDLYLIHWPASCALHENWKDINADTWKGMEDLYEEGIVKAIGVCNFKEHHLEALSVSANIKPMVDQFELHPGMPQKELLAYCNDNDIVVEASSPLGNGQILKDETISQIAAAHGKTPAQVCIRYTIKKGTVPIPKTANVDRLKENIDVFDFELSAEEVAKIDALPFMGGLNIDPDTVTEFG